MRYFPLIVALCVTASAFGDNNTTGPDGIDSTVTGLTGAGVLIGQGGVGRSGKFGYDMPNMSAMGTVPQGVYFRTSGGQDPPDSSHITEHETLVAGIMVGQASVAPAASLHSAAFGGDADDVDTALTLNRLATLSSGTVRAIDMSFYRALGFLEEGDGSSHLTSFVDWSARQHDVLYAVAWGNNVDSFPELVPLIVEKDGGSSPRTLQSGEDLFPLKGGTHHVPEKLPEDEESRQVADPPWRAA